MIWARLKKLWALSNLDSAHLGDLLERAADDARTYREIPLNGDGRKINYVEASFVPYEKVSPVKKITNDNES